MYKCSIAHFKYKQTVQILNLDALYAIAVKTFEGREQRGGGGTLLFIITQHVLKEI